MWATLKTFLWQWRGVWITAPSMAGLLLLIRLTGSLQLLEWAALDQFFQLRPLEPPERRVVLVTIGESDITQHGWPITDELMVQLLNRLKQQQPRAIGLDLYRNLRVEPGYGDLVKVFESTPNLIGIRKVINNPYGTAIDPPPVLAKQKQVGASDLLKDSDGKVRRSLISLKDSDRKTVFTLSTRLALAYLEAEGIKPQVVDASKGQIKVGRALFMPIAANAGGYVGADTGGYQILANFRNPQVSFQSVSMNDVLAGNFPTDFARDKVVLIGPTAESLGDFFYTSYSSRLLQKEAQTQAGVAIHALQASQIMSAALDGRPLIQTWAEPFEWIWILLWSGVGATLGWSLKSPQWTVLGIVIAGGGLVGVAYLMFLQGWWVIVVPPLLGLVGAGAVNQSYKLWNNLNLSYRALEEYSRTLEQRVEERTQEISQKNVQLQQEIRDRERAELALRESERRLRNQNAVLVTLSQNKALYRGDLTIALQEITAAAAHTLEIERVGVWLYDDTKNKLQCQVLYERSGDRHSSGAELTADDYPAYFQALKDDWLLVIDNAHADPRTQEFIAPYLIPLGVTGMLDVPIQLGGQMIGILCLEQTHSVHHWTVEEQNFAGSLADLTSLAIEAHGRQRAEAALRAEQEKSERLLLNILPAEIAEQLKQGEGAIATRAESVTVLFSDIVDFTGMAARLSPTDLVKMLNEIFSAFDQLAEKYGVEKIKTIGDAYMVVGGVPVARADHAEAIADMAIDMQQAIAQFRNDKGDPFRIRIGMNTGAIVAGVIGIKKFSYDLWGDTVNVASRMESQGEIGKIQVTEATYRLLKDKYEFEPRGAIAVKGRGEMHTYFLTGRKLA